MFAGGQAVLDLLNLRALRTLGHQGYSHFPDGVLLHLHRPELDAGWVYRLRVSQGVWPGFYDVRLTAARGVEVETVFQGEGVAEDLLDDAVQRTCRLVRTP